MPKANYYGVTDGPYMTPDYSWIANHRTLERSSPMEIAAGTVDAGNTLYRTTYLRPGLCMGKITASGKLAQYAPAAGDGTETIFGILAEGVDMLDAAGVAITTPVMGVVIIGGHIDARNCILIDAAGKADLRTAGFLLVEDYE